jgi:hypothetical protein
MSKPVSGNSTRVSSLSRHCGRHQHSAPTRHDRNQRQHHEAAVSARFPSVGFIHSNHVTLGLHLVSSANLCGCDNRHAAEHLCTLGNSLQAPAVAGHRSGHSSTHQHVPVLEALQVQDQDLWRPPQRHALGRLHVVLAPVAVPASGWRGKEEVAVSTRGTKLQGIASHSLRRTPQPPQRSLQRSSPYNDRVPTTIRTMCLPCPASPSP